MLAGTPTSESANLPDEMKTRDNTSEVEAVSDDKRDQKNIFVSPATDDFPDGGLRAWLVLFGAMCNTFSTFGYVNAWGVFQAYYQETILSNSSPSSIAWIGSLQYSLIFLPGLVVGRLFDLGYFRTLLWTASALIVVATFLVAQCTQYWQFLLCQGFAIGLASGATFGPTTAVLAHWFKRKRGFALGMIAVGSSVGGTLFPIIARNLISHVGFRWTMRLIGFILLVTLGSANLLLERRLPPINISGGLFNWAAFKSPAFTTYCLSSFFIFLGLYTVLTYIDISATSVGVSPDFSFYLVSIANASSGVGRYISGTLADKRGPTNVMIPFTTVAGVFTYSWPFARSQGSLIAIAVLYGFSTGSYTSLLSNPMMELGETEDVGRRLGMFMSILALGALAGPPISGAINAATGEFQSVGYYAGSVILIGSVSTCKNRRYGYQTISAWMTSAGACRLHETIFKGISELFLNPRVVSSMGLTIQPLYLALLFMMQSAQKLRVDLEKNDDINIKLTESNESPVTTQEEEYPDGGLRAWLVVVGTAFSSFSTFGYVNVWGVFQSYYERHTLMNDSPSAIAWIGSIQHSLVFMLGLITGRLFDLGYFRTPFLIATVILIVATFLVSQCTKYWQLLLCQGFAIGLSAGAIYGPTLGLIGHWFRKKRGVALGLTAVGSSVGGTIFPIAARSLIDRVGFPWTMRIIGFILLFSMGISNLTLARRLPAKNVSSGLFNWQAFRSLPFTVYCTSGAITFLGLFTLLTYIDISATFVGISPSFSFYLVSIANGSSTLGRYTAGALTDKWGGINVVAPLTAVAAAATFVWPFAKTQAALIIIAIVYGFAAGAYISSFMVPLYELGDIADLGRRTGMLLTISAMGALAGPPISGAINHATGGYAAVGYYAGSTIVLAVILMLLTRHLVLKRLWGKF